MITLKDLRWAASACKELTGKPPSAFRIHPVDMLVENGYEIHEFDGTHIEYDDTIEPGKVATDFE